uniref:Uncharacterized protein n=1 Tax=Rhizophora mucronata TaxID=61149 RepID=A0A2P2PP00_RHIMU
MRIKSSLLKFSHLETNTAKQKSLSEVFHTFCCP